MKFIKQMITKIIIGIAKFLGLELFLLIFFLGLDSLIDLIIAL